MSVSDCVTSAWGGPRIRLCEGVARARLGVRDARRDEAGATIYDRVPLRKWVL